MVALVKSLMLTGPTQNSLILNVVVISVLYADGDFVVEFGSKVLLSVVLLESSRVYVASAAVCCAHCFHCHFAQALDPVVLSFLVVLENRLSRSAQCELYTVHVPHYCAYSHPQNQVYFPSNRVFVSCLGLVKNLRIANLVAR